MKNLVIILLLISHYSMLAAQTPNAKEWLKQKKTQRKYLAQQIEALQVHLEYVKTGYKIVDKGLTAVSEIKNGTFNLDKDYFNSLKQVNPLIRKSPKVNEILVYQQVIINQFKSLINYCKKETHYSNGEINYVTKVYEGMLSSGKTAINELTIITTAGEAEMTDDERILRLDKVHEDMQDQFEFTKSFVASTKFLAIQRAKEEHQILALRKLYGIQQLEH